MQCIEYMGTWYDVDEIPNICPMCHCKMTLGEPLAFIERGDQEEGLSEYEVVFKCVNNECGSLFIAYYEDLPHVGYSYCGSKPKALEKKIFDDAISSLSPSFVRIFNEAARAEVDGLFEICGMGYRKALEFLIKDYCIVIHPDEKEKIIKASLQQCITRWVEDRKVKEVAQRAVWLGNDETHYQRERNNHDLHDLKVLIDLTQKWIGGELTYKKYLTELPHRGKKVS